MDITKTQYDILRFAMDKVQRMLEKGAGWKGRFIPYEFKTYFGISPTFGEGTVSLKQGGQTLFRCDRTLSGATVTGRMADSAKNFRDLLVKAVDRSLSAQNIADLRNETVGCSEYIPYVTIPGQPDRKCYFFPEERWDIRQTLLREKGFMEKDIRDMRPFMDTLRKDFLPEGTAVCTGLEMGAVLYDGRDIRPLSDGLAMSDPLLLPSERRRCSSQADLLVDVAEELRRAVYDRVLSPMVQSAAITEEEAQGLKFCRGVEVRVLDKSLDKNTGVFLWNDGRPVWGAYINSGGRLSISPDGAAYRSFPQPALYHDSGMERNFDIKAIRSMLEGQILSDRNIQILRDEALGYVERRERVVVPAESPVLCARELGVAAVLPARAWLQEENRWVVGEVKGMNFEYYNHDDKVVIPTPFTTSRYTGMRDSAGNRIWEGDVLDCSEQGLGKGYIIPGDETKGQNPDRFYVAFTEFNGEEISSRKDISIEDFVGQDVVVTASIYVSEKQGPKLSR